MLAAPSLLDALGQSLQTSGANFRDSRTAHGLADGINLIAGESAKGLEFDAVVVVEPSTLIAEHAGGLQAGYRTLFVSLTRATQRVVLVHAEPLPRELTLTS